MQLRYLILISVFYFLEIQALSTPPLRTKCRARSPDDPLLQPASCIKALSDFLHQHPDPSYTFSTLSFRASGSIRVPLYQTHRDCTVGFSLFYVSHARASISSVVAAVDEIVEDCVGSRRWGGGSRVVGRTGLWVHVVPIRDARRLVSMPGPSNVTEPLRLSGLPNDLLVEEA